MAELSSYEGKLYWNPGTGAVLVGQVRDIEGPGMKLDVIDVSSRDGSKRDTYISGLNSVDEVTFDIVYDPDVASQNALSVALLAGTIGRMFLVLRVLGEKGWHGAAVVNGFKPKAPLSGVFTADVSFGLLQNASELRYLSDGGGVNFLADGNLNYVVA